MNAAPGDADDDQRRGAIQLLREPAGWRGLIPSQSQLGAAPVIATGHQAWLWHPGILAKYLAADSFASSIGGSTRHVVVDHDVYHPWSLDLPFVTAVRGGPRLDVIRFDASPLRPGTPAYLYPSVNPMEVVDRLHALVKRAPGQPAFAVEALTEWWRAAPQVLDTPRLLDQMVSLLGRRVSGYADAVPWRTIGLVDAATLDRLRRDPRGAVVMLNRSVAMYPEARMRPLHVGVDEVELPVWAIGPRGRTPVYAALHGRGRAELFTVVRGQTQPLDPEAIDGFAPRAALLTALMRSQHADLFIHGKGGGIYDQVTEQWWQDWTGETLKRMAVASADVRLALDVPVATAEARDRAVWRAHHLPHNLDRALALTGGAIERKRDLLAHMNDDRDRSRRRTAFAEIHRINGQLASEHVASIAAAKLDVEQTEIGVRNARQLARRDWCFALYDPKRLTTVSS